MRFYYRKHRYLAPSTFDVMALTRDPWTLEGLSGAFVFHLHFQLR